MESIGNTLRRGSVLIAAGVCIAAATGCYERNLAPPLEYSQDDVDKLNEQIEEIDWDE